ncbi:uncharacterized protein SCODWIG_00853 [Saccharomycodes ludwigii]|uniref:DNA mismatch repair protein MLH3 n=1 Tax=Saccharomycodes ludwigii TaxID=36035 RepID=A0A376B3A3_9ASCO|nr:hypothetical protein SCDLUD_002172 [Saccharomycodes ludwigii]KAH3902352.1 hypothetical protein SCDLUD_002172 [Saccharomycodes ludwigii]SSD59092.1 uncharacterized protein SCODWIG_00853 [Saccharomycodes ludwigii]
MNSIYELDSKTIANIRSELVIPSFTDVLKELIENSIDANATEINCTIDLSTLKIFIQDNGDGIDRCGLSKIGKVAYITTKIKKINDLPNLSTFGFRGEALYSICKNCTKVKIISKRKDYNTIWCIKRSDNQNKNVDFELTRWRDDPPILLLPTHGTIIEIDGFLEKFPIRRKTIQQIPAFKLLTEIKLLIFNILCCKPFINFTLETVTHELLIKSTNVTSHNNKELIHVFTNVFGYVIPTNFFKRVALSFQNISIDGVISTTSVPTNRFQHIFINNRLYENPRLLKEINQVFNNFKFGQEFETKSVGTPYSHYPIIILRIFAPQNISDLIQSPSKKVILHSAFDKIHILVMKIIEGFVKHLKSVAFVEHNQATLPTSNTLLNFNGQVSDLTTIRETKLAITNKRSYPDISSIAPNTKLEKTNFKRISPKRITHNYNYYRHDINKASQSLPNVINSTAKEINIKHTQLRSFRIINQVDNKFILVKIPSFTENNELLLLIDQHAADERVKLEMYLHDYIIQRIKTPTLNVCSLENPISLQVTSLEMSSLEYYYSEFEVWGFSIQKTTSTSIVVKCLPQILNQRIGKDYNFLKNGILQHLYDLQQGKRCKFKKNLISEWWVNVNSIPILLLELFTSKSCRNSIMFGDELTLDDCQSLVTKLAECNMPFNCAHGRPSIVPLFNIDIKQNESIINKMQDYLL